jgi:hypothetical protein
MATHVWPQAPALSIFPRPKAHAHDTPGPDLPAAENPARTREIAPWPATTCLHKGSNIFPGKQIDPLPPLFFSINRSVPRSSVVIQRKHVMEDGVVDHVGAVARAPHQVGVGVVPAQVVDLPLVHGDQWL